MTIATHLSRSGIRSFGTGAGGPILLLPLVVGPRVWAHYPFTAGAVLFVVLRTLNKRALRAGRGVVETRRDGTVVE